MHLSNQLKHECFARSIIDFKNTSTDVKGNNAKRY